MNEQIQSGVRTHLGAVTAVLSAVSLGLVFAAAGGAIPPSALPESGTVVEVIPHLNSVISLVAIGTILAGVRAIRRREVTRHRRLMVTSFVLFATFLTLYLYKVVVAGTSTFGGPDAVRQFVYLPILGIHMLLAMASVPLVYYALLVAATHDVSEIPQTRHPTVGRTAAALWLISFVLGIVVYLLLYVIY